MSGTLSGKRVLVIGASAGIGRALAVRAVQEGAQVLMAARRGAELEKAAAEARGGHPVTVDVRAPEDCARLAAAARETLGQIDILAFTVGAATLQHDGRHRRRGPAARLRDQRHRIPPAHARPACRCSHPNAVVMVLSSESIDQPVQRAWAPTSPASRPWSEP